jgi:hypothetical protein
VRSYFQAPSRRNDLSSRHDPATASPDNDRWYAGIDDLLGRRHPAVAVAVWLVEAGVCSAIAAGWFVAACLL